MKPKPEALRLEAFLQRVTPEVFNTTERKRQMAMALLDNWRELTDDQPVRELTSEAVEQFNRTMRERCRAYIANESRYILLRALRMVWPEKFKYYKRGRRWPAVEFTREPGKVYLVDCVETYAKIRLSGKSPEAKEHHLQAVSRLRKFLEREPTTEDLNEETYGSWISWLLECGRCDRGADPGLSRQTVSMYSGRLLCLWRYCCRRRLVELWPEQQKFKAPKRTPHAWMRDELSRLYKAVEASKGFMGNVPSRLWWGSLLSVAWDTGERRSALLSIQWGWIDLRTGWLRIPAEARKGKESDKVWELHPDTLKLLRELDRYRLGDRVWVAPTYETVSNRLKKILKAAELPTTRGNLFHKIRRTVASFFEAGGGNATVLLGHSSRAVTEAYLDPRIVKPVQASAVLFRPTEAEQADTPQPQPQASIDADLAAALKLITEKLGGAR